MRGSVMSVAASDPQVAGPLPSPHHHHRQPPLSRSPTQPRDTTTWQLQSKRTPEPAITPTANQQPPVARRHVAAGCAGTELSAFLTPHTGRCVRCATHLAAARPLLSGGIACSLPSACPGIQLRSHGPHSTETIFWSCICPRFPLRSACSSLTPRNRGCVASSP